MTGQHVKNNELSSVGIIGCGWLGTALANELNVQGNKVLATRSNSENVEQLTQQGIDGEVLSLPAEQAYLNKHPIFNQECLVIAITPQFKRGRVDYGEKIQQIVVAAQASPCVKKIILLNSTAIYNGLSGQVDESIALDLTAEKVAVLNEAEQAVLNLTGKNDLEASDSEHEHNSKHDSANKRAYVLRLSGLVGPNRHPGKFLLNRSMLKNPNAIVNLIHQQDAVGLIIALIKSNISTGIFNGVSATQVTKKHYYETAANALKLPTPSFESTEPEVINSSKVISAIKTKELINYSFVYDDLLNWLGEGID